MPQISSANDGNVKVLQRGSEFPGLVLCEAMAASGFGLLRTNTLAQLSAPHPHPTPATVHLHLGQPHFPAVTLSRVL